jgi:hypothetical protein
MDETLKRKAYLEASRLQNSIIYFFLVFILTLLISCTDRSVEIYIDVSKEAIISCNGNAIREVDINSPDSTITYTSFGDNKEADTIHFNKKNSAFRITVSWNSINNNYILNLKPNSSYEIKSRSSNGDQGPFRLVFKTNSKGYILDEQANHCK